MYLAGEAAKTVDATATYIGKIFVYDKHWRQISIDIQISFDIQIWQPPNGKVEKTDPRSAGYPTDYYTDYPPRTTLNNQPNYFYGEEKHKKPTCSHVHDHN